MSELPYIIFVTTLATLLAVGIAYLIQFIGERLLRNWGVTDAGKLRRWSAWAGLMFLVLAMMALLSIRD